MCAIMLPDGRWTHVPHAVASGSRSPERNSSSGSRSPERNSSWLRSPERNSSWLRSAEGASRNQLAPVEHSDDARAVALLVAHDAHDEALVLEQ